MKLVEFCHDKNAYVATLSSKASIVRQEKYVVTFRNFIVIMT